MLKLQQILDKLLFCLVVFLIAFIPLFPKIPLSNIVPFFPVEKIPGTFVAIRLEDFVIAFILGIWVINLLVKNVFKTILKDKLILAFGLFFIAGLLSLYSALFITQTIIPHLGLLHYVRRIEYMMLLPLAWTVIKTRRQLIAVLLVLSAVVIAVNIYAFGQQYLSWPLTSTTNSEFSKGLILYLTPGARVNSSFAGHYDLAIFLAMSLSVIAGLFFGIKNILVKIYMLIIAGSSVVVLIMTAARLSFVAAVIGITTALILARKKKYLLYFALLVSVALIFPSQMRDRLISTVTVNLINQGERFVSANEAQNRSNDLNIPTLPVRVIWTASSSSETATTANPATADDIAPGEPTDTTQLGVYRSFSIRLNQEWPRAIRGFIKNPFLGTGYSSLGLATDNDFLRILGEIGLLGTIPFILIIWEIVKRVKRNIINHDKLIKLFSVGTIALMVAFIVNGLFIDAFESSKVAMLFWLLVGANLSVNNFKSE